FGNCASGQCCSKKGYCGKTDGYCSSTNGCQSEFGQCKCGSKLGSCNANRCCSKKGYCGETNAYCSTSNGCQSGFGLCRCGAEFGKCTAGQCCNKDGYCGTTTNYCSKSNGCQSEFGDCKCGKEFGKCGTGLCCSKKGYCGKTDAYCLSTNGCQMNYGLCGGGQGNQQEESSQLSKKYIPENMEESYDELQNPYRGWFHGSVTVDLTDNADTDCNFIYAFSKVRHYKNGLQYLGIRLSEYYNKEISQEALIFFENLLYEYRKRKEEIDPTTQIMLKFYYDSGTSSTSKIRLLNGSKKQKLEKMNIKKEKDDGELYITHEDIQYMKEVFNPNINSDVKHKMNKKSNLVSININDNNKYNANNNINFEKRKFTKFSKRDGGQFFYIEENDCYKYIPTDKEPVELSTILGHIDQLSKIVNKYSDIIYIYQGVFVGKWGEMHSTTHSLSLKSSTEIMRAINEKFDPSIFLAVRTPCHYRAFSSEIQKLNKNEYNKLISRLSLFNDGLFGSETDTGTYGDDIYCFEDDQKMLYLKKPREEEVQFQKELCLDVPNGGEVLSNTDDDIYEEIYELSDIKKAIAEPDNYNNFYVCEEHSKNIHVSYFNDEYDRLLYRRWNITFSKQIYKPEWNSVSGEEYMGHHLGYRYVLRDSSFNNSILSISLENIGFAPSYRPFQSLLVLKSSTSNHSVILNIDTDNTDWPLNEKVTLTINLKNDLSKLTDESYDVYFKLYDPNLDYDIKFANTNNYNENDGYKIGQLTSKKK
ncbi:carbohydrate-binding module family 18 protein, partial [Piromyces sp. E2]